MRNGNSRNRAILGLLCGSALAVSVAQMQALPREKRIHDDANATMVALALPTHPPKGAIILYSGKPEELHDLWYKRYSTDPAGWTIGNDGVATPNHTDIATRQEFGDCFVHVEFCEPTDAAGKTIGDGNSGVGFQGRYEVQILDSYGKAPEAHQCGALYSQKKPIVIASKKPGEWQTYDIIFRAPRFDDAGKVTEKARATVFQNGILVQNNEEFNGPTGIQYSQYKGEVKSGPLILQGDHDPVQFRNVWIVPQ